MQENLWFEEIFAETESYQEEHFGNKQKRGLCRKLKIDCSHMRTMGINLNCPIEHVELMKENTFKIPQLVHGTHCYKLSHR